MVVALTGSAGKGRYSLINIMGCCCGNKVAPALNYIEMSAITLKMMQIEVEMQNLTYGATDWQQQRRPTYTQ